MRWSLNIGIDGWDPDAHNALDELQTFGEPGPYVSHMGDEFNSSGSASIVDLAQYEDINNSLVVTETIVPSAGNSSSYH